MTSASLAIVFTVANSIGPVTIVKLGPKFVILAGGILFGDGMLLSGFAKSIESLVVSYGVLCGLGCF